jgi:hypothetical protein
MNGIVVDYSSASIEEARNHFQRFLTPRPFEETLPLIRHGYFAVSHLSAAREVQRALSDFQVIFLYREMRATFLSHLRFFATTERETANKTKWRDLPEGPEKALVAFDDFGVGQIEMCRCMVDWYDGPGITKLSFEELFGDYGEAARADALRRVAATCRAETDDINLRALLSTAIATQTITSSGARTDVGQYWSEALEERFRAEGALSINKRLGYPAAGDVDC